MQSWKAALLALGLSVLAPLLFGCAMLQELAQPEPPAAPEAPPAAVVMNDPAEERASDRERITSLEREIERLRADLAQAEAPMLATDSEIRAGSNRTAAVSLLAEASISVDQAAKAAPWRPASVEEARRKLTDAEQQLRSGDPAAAVYFASRGRRIADTLLAEARVVAKAENAHFVKVERLNLRAGPSTTDHVVGVLESGTPLLVQRGHGKWKRVRTLDGELGWVHASLLSKDVGAKQAGS